MDNRFIIITTCYNVNPYLDEDYYIWRIIHNVEIFRGAIYRKHNFKCYACEQALYGPEEVHLHHMLSRKDGGLYTLENIVPVHATCHENITYARKDLNQSRINML